jgi:hypothetical protein
LQTKNGTEIGDFNGKIHIHIGMADKGKYNESDCSVITHQCIKIRLL